MRHLSALLSPVPRIDQLEATQEIIKAFVAHFVGQQGKIIPAKRGQYRGHWSPGDLRRQDISHDAMNHIRNIASWLPL